MFLTPIFKPTKILKINASDSDYNLYTESNSPYYSLNLICQINATLSGTSSSSPAFQTGNGWKAGTWILIYNNNTLEGYDGSNGSNGAGGAGGNAYSSLNGGNAGGNGIDGENGGIALSVNVPSGVLVSLDNLSGIINGGIGGIGGIGGGGGGGAGGEDQYYTSGSEGELNGPFYRAGGGGGGGAGSPIGTGGLGNPNGTDGTSTLGGSGGIGTFDAGDGGNGGNLGLAGQNGTSGYFAGGSGGISGSDGLDGSAGAAINGYSLLNVLSIGTINGSIVQ